MLIDERIKENKHQFISSYNYALTYLKISIVIPMYNEENSIENVLLKIPYLPNCEIIVIDDGSIDNSKNIVRRFDNVKLYSHMKNMGYGQSLLDGIYYASGDIIVTLDSDGQHEPRDIINLIEPIIENNADIVIGSRYKGEYYYNLPLSTRIGESFIELMISLLFGAKVKNNQSGFRAFKRDTINTLFEDIQFKGFASVTETIIKAKLENYKIQEAPIHLYNREYGKSRIHLLRLLLSLLHCLMHYTVFRFDGQKSLQIISKLTKKFKIFL